MIRGRRALRAGVTTGGALLGALGLVVTPAMAAWTDHVPVTGATLTTATVPAPVLACGLLGLGSVQFTWPAVPGASGYRITFTDSTGTNTVSSDTTQTSVTATSASVITGGTAVVRTKVTYPGGATWISAASNSRGYTVVAGLLGLCT